MRRRIFLRLLTVVVLTGTVTAAVFAWLEEAGRSWRGSLAAGLALSVLLGSALAWLLASRLSRWLGTVEGFAQALARRQLSARFSHSAPIELSPAQDQLEAAARRLEVDFERLKASREQLEMLVNSMEDALVAISPRQEVVWFNDAMKRLAGGSIELGKPLIRALRDPDLVRAASDVLKRRQVESATLFSLVPGQVFSMTATPLPDGGAVCMLRDTTQIARVERTRRDFIANVSHELRTPLTSLLGYTETLLDESVDPKARSFLEIIRRNAQRMSRLTEDLLMLARVESGEDRLELGAVPAGDLVRDAQTSLDELARSRGLEIDIATAPDQLVWADKDAIHQVFANLIDNALKYAPDTQRIEIGAIERGTELEFYVRDFGPGIPSEHVPRLFERFYRVDKARSREAGGTGLGLAIVKHIVLNHGGQIGVNSELGHGSMFWFRLRRAEAVRDSTAELVAEP